jgi:hypothetical protein
MAQAVSRRPLTAAVRGSIPGQSIWDSWWTKWHWDRFFSPVLQFFFVNFIPPVLHYLEKRKTLIIFLFIKRLHNKPQGCGASVASAAGPFTKKSGIFSTPFTYMQGAARPHVVLLFTINKAFLFLTLKSMKQKSFLTS